MPACTKLPWILFLLWLNFHDWFLKLWIFISRWRNIFSKKLLFMVGTLTGLTSSRIKKSWMTSNSYLPLMKKSYPTNLTKNFMNYTVDFSRNWIWLWKHVKMLINGRQNIRKLSKSEKWRNKCKNLNLIEIKPLIQWK